MHSISKNRSQASPGQTSHSRAAHLRAPHDRVVFLLIAGLCAATVMAMYLLRAAEPTGLY